MNPRERFLNAVFLLAGILVAAPRAVRLAVEFGEDLDHEGVSELGRLWARKRTEFVGFEKLGQSSVIVHPRLRLCFSLMVGESAESVVEWGIEAALREEMDKFIDEIGQVLDVVVDSQVLYFSGLTKDHAQQVIDKSELEGFVSANDWNAESLQGDDRETVFHLLSFLPNSRKVRLIERKGSNAQETIDSFIVPRWGGVHILPVSLNETHFVPVNVVRSSMHVFKKQLSSILQLDPSIVSSGTLAENDKRRWLANFLASSVQTLNSLSQLIRDSSHMLVLKRVQGFVELSMQDANYCIANCTEKDMKISQECLEKARRSFLNAERAFFDPTLLPQLYFPPEHFVAVFMPFLLPALLPIIFGFPSSLKSLFSVEVGI